MEGRLVTVAQYGGGALGGAAGEAVALLGMNSLAFALRLDWLSTDCGGGVTGWLCGVASMLAGEEDPGTRAFSTEEI